MGIFDRLFSGVKNTNTQRPDPARIQPRPVGRPMGRPIPQGNNQFNYPGPYYKYFMDIFRQNFPGYDIKEGAVPNPRFTRQPDSRAPFALRTCERERNQTVYSFRRGNAIELIVQVVHSKFTDDNMRRTCERTFVPYLRFYYDHYGWFNERSYVVSRVRDALALRTREDTRARVHAVPWRPSGANGFGQPAVRPAQGASIPTTPAYASRTAPAATPTPITRVQSQAPSPSSVHPMKPAPVGRYATPDAESPWSETMPREENQYNYPGPYYEYFKKLFLSEFARYSIQEEARLKPVARPRPGMGFAPRTVQPERIATVFTFWYASRKALVVEIISESSETCRLRNECFRQNIPYLRFYYNHKRWWNTRSYVIGRVRRALNI